MEREDPVTMKRESAAGAVHTVIPLIRTGPAADILGHALMEFWAMEGRTNAKSVAHAINGANISLLMALEVALDRAAELAEVEPEQRADALKSIIENLDDEAVKRL